MCGIIGYKGHNDGVDLVLKGLKRLEYRGYDSWGIAGIKDESMKVMKLTGQIGKIKRDDIPISPSPVALGHTRWATHGGVTDYNAHPHLSKKGRFAVVHNGIIENFKELKDELISKNTKFVSDTDTEVISHLLEDARESSPNLKNALMKVLGRLEGGFAIVAVDRQTAEMAGARNGSPLVLGIGKEETFFASDVPAFLDSTRNVVYIDDGEAAIVDGEVTIFNYTTGKEIKRSSEKISWSIEEAEKGNYPHFMLKEINEQGSTIKKAIEQDPELIEIATDMIKNAFGVFFVGAGTSLHACVSASYVFSEVAKKHVNVVSASEFRNYKDFLTDRTLMVAVSQSGETADLLDAVKVAKSKGVKILAIVNVMGSTLMRMADQSILMNSGPEICVLSTKTYTSQVAILLQLAYSVAGSAMEGKELILKAATATPKILSDSEPIAKELAKKIKNNHSMFLIGRDLAYPSALEGALKIKEVSYVHAEGFAGGDLKHGAIALIEKDVPVIVLVTKATKHLIESNAMEVKARGGYLIGVGAYSNEIYDSFFKVPSLGAADPLVMIPPIQLLAYYLALERGCDPDKPRNLAKSVTVK
ncbi:MAG TPA: glutamine--fructose-6-phosphate transaminase (isomerizing) [Candidatus Nanoarchaeia archaeon]|nr:glutamine--fructose-6-phosphate transaminase (isomerizing) [Candidatus Nanoarchaeia archaeon]